MKPKIPFKKIVVLVILGCIGMVGLKVNPTITFKNGNLFLNIGAK